MLRTDTVPEVIVKIVDYERNRRRVRECVVIEQRVPRFVYITESEMIKLIGESTRENQAKARFGGGRVWLDDEPANQWAFKRLAEWRGVNLTYDY